MYLPTIQKPDFEIHEDYMKFKGEIFNCFGWYWYLILIVTVLTMRLFLDWTIGNVLWCSSQYYVREAPREACGLLCNPFLSIWIKSNWLIDWCMNYLTVCTCLYTCNIRVGVLHVVTEEAVCTQFSELFGTGWLSVVRIIDWSYIQF